MVQYVILAFVFFFTGATALAHGTGQHVLGTVTAIDSTHLAIKTPKGATVDVQINKETRFKEKGNPKGTNLPAVGDRVVIEATKDNKVLTATEVHFSAAKRVQPAAPTATQPAPAPSN
jgi:uncharacterized protein DUF5666